MYKLKLQKSARCSRLPRACIELIGGGTSKQQSIRFDPLLSVSWDFRPIFRWILSLISKVSD